MTGRYIYKTWQSTWLRTEHSKPCIHLSNLCDRSVRASDTVCRMEKDIFRSRPSIGSTYPGDAPCVFAPSAATLSKMYQPLPRYFLLAINGFDHVSLEERKRYITGCKSPEQSFSGFNPSDIQQGDRQSVYSGNSIIVWPCLNEQQSYRDFEDVN